MASRKISEMPAKLSMVSTDEFTILDRDGGVPLPEINKRVTRTVALSGYATDADVSAVQSNLDTHEAAQGVSAHPDTATLTDLNGHKAGANQHPISGVTGLQTALDEKADTASLGNSATRDVGTGPGDVAAGDAPAAAVTAHESTYDHTNLPTTNQKAALDAANAPSGGNAFVTAADTSGFLTAVIDDTDPNLGGDLKVGGASNYIIQLTDAANAQQGSVGYTTGTYEGTYIARTPDDAFDEDDGGVLFAAGTSTVFGANVVINGLKHTHPSGYQTLNITENGVVFGTAPPAPGWSHTDTGVHREQLTGTGTTWVRVADLTNIVQADVAAGERLDIVSNVYLENLSGTRGGTVAIGFGYGASPPSSAASVYPIVGGFSGYVILSTSTTTHGGLLTNDEISIWCRRESQEHAQFDPYIAGDIDQHESILSVPGEGGSGGGTPTNITVTQTDPNDVLINSSTGSNGTMVPATNTVAGGMSAAQVQTLERLDTGPARVDANPTTQTITTNLDGRAYTVQPNNDENITTWTAGLGTGGAGTAADNEFTCSVDFLPPAAGGAITVSIPAAWKQMGELSAISLSPGDEVITVILRSRKDGTIQWYGEQEQ